MRGTSQIGSNYLFYNFIRVVKILLTWEQFAWVNIFIHQRLNIEHSSNIIANKNIYITTQELTKNKELFYQ
jgi:hypothetical protein